MRHVRLTLLIAGKLLREISRMPGILAVMFLPGIGLYSVFTLIFSGGSDDGPSAPRIVLAVVDQDQSFASKRLVAAAQQMGLKTRLTDSEGQTFDTAAARHLVEKHDATAALIIPQEYGLRGMPGSPQRLGVELIIDEAQPMQIQMVNGMLQMAAGRAMFDPTLKLDTGPDTTEGAPVEQDEAAATAQHAAVMPLQIETSGVATTERKGISWSLLYLAGLVPLFLLFNATGAANSLLEELDSGGIARILVAPVAPAHILLGNMAASMVLCLCQCAIMYLFAWLVFNVPIWSVIGGLAVLTVVTSAATVGFGMLMASIFKTSEQLNAIGTVIILGMSALGGSMIPRIIMPKWVQDLGLLTINGWAYDGFVELVRSNSLRGPALQIAVLLGIAAVFATLGSLLLSRRLRGSRMA